MNLTNNAQAILLLTSYFSKPVKGAAKPLTITEWGRFAHWLYDKKHQPADLLGDEQQDILSRWQDAKATSERISELLARGHSLALAVDKWQRSGLWILTRADEEYPKRLKQKLRNDAPPVLFGCGNKDLLNSGGIAVVGSRNVGAEDLQFTEGLGQKAALSGIGTVSGGARGVDEASMLSAISAGGNVIGIMADSLLRAATSAKWRNGLMQGNTVLISPFYPEAGFNAGNAMSRNKYIYTLSDAAVVVHSGTKGGTWNGARENIKKQWVPIWIKPTNDTEAGNNALVSEGAQWCSGNLDELEFDSLFTQIDGISPQDDMFSLNESVESDASNLEPLAQEKLISATQTNQVSIDFYSIFIQQMQAFSVEPVNITDITSNLELHKSQVTEWLKRAIEEGHIVKLTNPVRFQWNKGN